MRLLFDDRLAPITSDLGFVRCGAGRLVRWFSEWQVGIQAKRGAQVAVRRVSTPTLEALLRSLEPLTNVERRRYLFVETRGGEWTAFFDNGWRGTDTGLLSYAASQLRCEAVRCCAVQDTLGSEVQGRTLGRYGATIFALYGTGGETVRHVYAMNDGGRWSFGVKGNALPFEETSRYTVRRKRDRFDPALLDTYLRALGIRAFDEDFYATDADLVEVVGPHSAQMKEYSLHEARATFGAT